MKRNRHRARAGVDLIGFLDILSVVMVIVLLVISVLALSVGVQGGDRVSPELENVPAEVAQDTAEKDTPSALVEMKTIDGQNVTASTTFLLCKSRRLLQFDPNTAKNVGTWSLDEQSAVSIAQQLDSPNVFLAVAGSCFPSLDELVGAFRSSGSQLGYEPTSDEAEVPWQ
jgi:hypothetical protein